MAITISTYVKFLATLYGEFETLEGHRMSHGRLQLRVGNTFGTDYRTIEKHVNRMLEYGLLTDTGEAYMLREVTREAIRQHLADGMRVL